MRLALVVAALATFALNVCALRAQNPEKAMILTEAHNGKEISIGRTATLTVKLPAQFGTGYSWEVAGLPAALLTAVGKPGIEATESTGAGRKERQVFTFRPVEPGSAVLKFQYVRPWEKDEKPQKVYAVKVTVE